MKLVLASCLKFSREDAVVISFGSEFHNSGAVAENDLSKREVLDLYILAHHLSQVLFSSLQLKFARYFTKVSKIKCEI